MVTKVVDGDSLELNRSGRMVRVRLYGIDAPEFRQPGGRAATREAWLLLNGRSVRVEPMGRDQYGRVVALVYREDGLLANREMVYRGQAWVYSRYCRKPSLCREWKDLERYAKARRVGLWRKRHYLPPWQWRRHDGQGR